MPMRVALALSYLIITHHITHSHMFIILTFWEEFNLHMWFQQLDAFTLVSSGNLLKWFERSDLKRLESVSEGIYTWSSHDRTAI